MLRTWQQSDQSEVRLRKEGEKTVLDRNERENENIPVLRMHVWENSPAQTCVGYLLKAVGTNRAK